MFPALNIQSPDILGAFQQGRRGMIQEDMARKQQAMEQERLAQQKRMGESQIETAELERNRLKAAMAQQPEIRRLQTAAAAGDQNALAQLAGLDPNAASKVQGVRQGIDTASREDQEHALKLVGNSAAILLSMPEEQREAAYQVMRPRLEGLGVPVPDQVPDENTLRGYVMEIGDLTKALETRRGPEQWEPIRNDAGEITGQRNKVTGEVKKDPRAPEADKPSAQEERIDRLTANLVAGGMEPDEARNKAVAIADGRYAVSRDPLTNTAIVVDKATGEEVGGQEMAVAASEDADQASGRLELSGTVGDEGVTLWKSTEGVPGFRGALVELYGRVFGQVGLGEGESVQETTANRQFFSAAKNDLIRSLSINPRFPVGEINRLDKEIQIGPKVWDSEGSLKTRMKTIDRFLRNRLDVERAAVEDRRLPADTRQAAAQASKEITAFLRLMGVPQDGGEQGAKPKGDSKAKRQTISEDLPPLAVDEGVTADEWRYMTREERAMYMDGK